ncbi:alcohol dehydrogenase transcription factor myb/SANT-like domain-containing protein [Ditylenchus destructor]|uniref:Alcohol dehydrogenase transcription factor myb/SANT-like domain-containing protein n=1 Tax=Ditylenchus destructor TaxID=166010 RepID=A0AAD4MK15_9BILA|nr:alcohol dehydrogenase transcription factor myb/SANT-like domain-containing protein [Ditylenchus destructor]
MSPTWTDLSKLLLIREYQLRPYLYEAGHNSRIERQRGINEIVDVLSSNGANFTATQISAQLRYLKVTYKKHLLKMEQDRLDGKPVSLPSWKFFKHLRFLGDLDVFNEDMRSVSAPKSTSRPRPPTPHVQRKVNRTRNKTPAANQTLATQIPSPIACPSHAINLSRAKSVHRPAVGRPVVNWAANQEAVSSLLNETKPYYLHGAAARRAVSCPKRPQIEPESPESAQHNQTTVKIEAVARWSNYDYTLENNGFGQGFGLTPQSQRMAQLRRCTVDLSPAAENEQGSTTEGDDDEANEVAVVDDSEEDPDFKHFGAFVTKTLKRMSTNFDPNVAKRARTNIKDMLFHVEFIRMRSDYAAV